jgi:RHS repeat-associated protein
MFKKIIISLLVLISFFILIIIIISLNRNNLPDLGKKYKWNYTGKNDLIITDSSNTMRIPGRIIDYNLNKDVVYTKDYQITDYLGNVRIVLSLDVSSSTFSINSYDYKPFGDTVSTTTGKEERLGFIGRERDFENNYFCMGARQFDAETGRFLSVDPLFEEFRNHTPYHYAYNSSVHAILQQNSPLPYKKKSQTI